jgi:hypothetical protein
MRVRRFVVVVAGCLVLRPLGSGLRRVHGTVHRRRDDAAGREEEKDEGGQVSH